MDTIAVGPNADSSLEQLAQRTGGQSYYHLDGTSDIIGAFSAQAAAQRAGKWERHVCSNIECPMFSLGSETELV